MSDEKKKSIMSSQEQAYKQAIQALRDKRYHKLIIGAALKDFKLIEYYAYLFTHAKAHVLDVSAFPHSIISAKRGIDKALAEDSSLSEPLIMASINIADDPHFRRIQINWDNCVACKLCIPTCPSDAFFLAVDEEPALLPGASKSHLQIGAEGFSYNPDLCFGCSNCLPACNFDAMSFTQWSAFNPESLAELIDLGVNAFEIHLGTESDATEHMLTQFREFYRNLPELPENFLQSFSITHSTDIKLWEQRKIRGAGKDPQSKHNVRSIEEEESSLISMVQEIQELVAERHGAEHPFIIQTDGIAMSAARNVEDKNKDMASISNAGIVLDYLQQNPSISAVTKEKLRGTVSGQVASEDTRYGPHKNIFVQLAGGIDEQSLAKAHQLNVQVNGVAIGSYARSKLKQYVTEDLCLSKLSQAVQLAKTMIVIEGMEASLTR